MIFLFKKMKDSSDLLTIGIIILGFTVAVYSER